MNRSINTFSLILILAICAIACKKDDLGNNKTLTGRWKDIGGYISSGGPQYWVKAKNISYLQLNADSTMKWDASVDFIKYRLKDNTTLKMSNADSTKYEDYNFILRHDTLILSPRGPIVCFEGCSTYFKRVK